MITKTMITPVLATIALGVQLIFGIEIPEEVLHETAALIVNAALVGTTLWGIYRNHKEKTR